LYSTSAIPLNQSLQNVNLDEAIQSLESNITDNFYRARMLFRMFLIYLRRFEQRNLKRLKQDSLDEYFNNWVVLNHLFFKLVK